MPARRIISKPDEIAYHRACAPLDATVADLVRVAGCRVPDALISCGAGARRRDGRPKTVPPMPHPPLPTAKPLTRKNTEVLLGY
ncbi:MULTISPECIES: hypothetical protein [unclassified Streptomyces]|uniref:hypothetical protein n=1 Tax=unclassified Streptomyces TaxID=2593676 RepID=UPI0033CFE164